MLAVLVTLLIILAALLGGLAWAVYEWFRPRPPVVRIEKAALPIPVYTSPASYVAGWGAAVEDAARFWNTVSEMALFQAQGWQGDQSAAGIVFDEPEAASFPASLRMRRAAFVLGRALGLPEDQVAQSVMYPAPLDGKPWGVQVEHVKVLQELYR